MLHNIIIRPRQTGKTSDAVKYCLEHGYTLLVANEQRKKYILSFLMYLIFQDTAVADQKRSQLKVITYSDVWEKTGRGSSIKNQVVVDDFTDFMDAVFRGTVEVVGITDTAPHFITEHTTKVVTKTFRMMNDLRGVSYTKNVRDRNLTFGCFIVVMLDDKVDEIHHFPDTKTQQVRFDEWSKTLKILNRGEDWFTADVEEKIDLLEYNKMVADKMFKEHELKEEVVLKDGVRPMFKF